MVFSCSFLQPLRLSRFLRVIVRGIARAHHARASVGFDSESRDHRSFCSKCAVFCRKSRTSKASEINEASVSHLQLVLRDAKLLASCLRLYCSSGPSFQVLWGP